MDSLPTAWETFFNQLRSPHRVLQSVVEYLFAWIFTRRWLVLASFAPALFAILTTGGLTIYGNMLADSTLIERYSNLATQEIEAPVAATSPSDADTSQGPDDPAESEEPLLEMEKVTPFGELLLRRVLQLHTSDTRATYLVAAQLGRSGRPGQARSMMRTLAPLKASGFAPAHAWLSVDHLQSGAVEPEQLDTLMHDLQEASTWHGTGPALIGIYADLLEQQGKVGEALAVLDRASGDSEALQLKLANMAYRNGRTKQLEEVAPKIKIRLEQRARSGEAKGKDFATLANLFLLESDPVRAEKSAVRGLQIEPDSPSLKRLLSESYRIQYLQSVTTEGGKVRVNLALLDAALKSDPSNPAIGQEVAKLIAGGMSASPELQQALQDQLGSGQATALTHILLADRKLQGGELAAAIPHLEVALRQAPGNPTALNNLALAIARTDTDRLTEAKQWIDQAVATVPSSAEYLDTQGEIRGLLGDHHGAIESFEKAIGIDGTRVETRGRIAVEYEAVGLQEMADLQRKIISQK